MFVCLFGGCRTRAVNFILYSFIPNSDLFNFLDFYIVLYILNNCILNYFLDILNILDSSGQYNLNCPLTGWTDVKRPGDSFSVIKQFTPQFHQWGIKKQVPKDEYFCVHLGKDSTTLCRWFVLSTLCVFALPDQNWNP